jgi:predicted transcriptional regulator
MKKRSNMEIIDRILRSIDSGTTKTEMMYGAYVSFGQLREFLELLEKRQLVKHNEDSRLYWITERGIRFMNAYDMISEAMTSAQPKDLSIDESFIGV